MNTLLTEAEAASRLRMSPRSLRDLRQQGRIRYVAITARKIVYREDDLDEYVEVNSPPRLIGGTFEPAAIPDAPCVYFVRAGETGPIKIGHAKVLRNRMQTLRTANYEELYLLATVLGGMQLEQEYHQRFSKFRLRGEWFKPAMSLLAMIENIRGGD